ncbi:ABC transporter substrate-binding protein [Micromonospora cremea]|uniref:Amino acid ABC transporter substrate-binding protein, PAAT family n=1 Tax=Micromonospora cremea TaxID=709881 RepID=A0A1N5U299_9ACTN|nr:ABC transporter substrate-binding protein [Micromonospora cremea]SIM54398.1 amino acid ABC transporter substrate-binding protein, PAAT family [Micromonospora cremea]
MPNQRPKRTYSIATATLASAALLLGAAACGSTDQTTDASSTGTPGPVSTLLPESVQEAGTLTIATDAQLPPNNFVGPDGKTIIGVSVDMGNAVAKALGVKATFVNTKFASLITGLQAGRYDIAMSGITDTAERQKQVDFVDFIESGQVFIVPKGNPGKVDSQDAMCGKTLSLVTGTISVDLAEAQSAKCVQAGQEQVTILKFPTVADALLQLTNGRADANIANLGKAAYQSKESGGKLEVAGKPFATSYDAVAVKKGDKEMIAALQYGFDKIIKDGTYQKILEKWDVQDSAVDKVVVNGGDSLEGSTS